MNRQQVQLLFPYNFVINSMSSQNQEQAKRQAKRQAKETLKKIQRGSLAFSVFEKETLMIAGYSKAGKTTLGHLLCSSPLSITEKNGKCIYTLDNNSTCRFRQAKIGQTPVSQTQFPNVFEAKVKRQNTVYSPQIETIIVDCPGFGDNYGFNRIISNGYFQYQIFSKTPKLRFLLVMDYSDLTTGGGEKIRKLIVSFVNFLKNYQAVKIKILAATSFVITKVDSTISTTNIKEELRQLCAAFKNMNNLTNIQAMLTQVIGDMVQKDKIFLILKPKAGGAVQKGGIILNQIYWKTQSWERDGNNQQRRMQHINSSVAYQILDQLGSNKKDQLFVTYFDEFFNQLKFRRANFFTDNVCSIKNIVNLLAKDVLGTNSNKYIQGMQRFINENVYFDQQYQQQRQKTIHSLFGQLNPQMNTMRENMDKRMDFVNKFKILEHIQSSAKRIQDAQTNILTVRTIETLDAMKSFFVNMCNIIEQYQVNRQYTNTIYQYFYIAIHMIEQAKILIKILFANQDIQKKFIQLKQKQIVESEIFKMLTRVITQFAGIQVQQLKKKYIETVYLNSYQRPNIFNLDVIDFLTSCRNLSIQKQMSTSNLIISQYRKRKSLLTEDQLCSIGTTIYNYRIAFQNRTYPISLKDSVFDLSKALAQILVQLKKSSLAIQMYELICDPEGIFEILSLQLKQPNGLQTNQELIKFGKIADSYLRRQDAIIFYQKAYHSSKNYNQRKQIGQLIFGPYRNNVNPTMDINSCPYLQRLLKNQYTKQIPQALGTSIQFSFIKPKQRQSTI